MYHDTTSYQERADQKARWEKYRAAAQLYYPRLNAKVRDLCHVSETIDRDGAFVELVVWVPREELDQPIPGVAEGTHDPV